MVSQLLTDPYAVKILVATVRAPRCAQDISKQHGIPIAACYRRIKDLERFGLISCTEKRLNQQGKRVCYYISMVKTAQIYFEEGRLKVKFEMKDGSMRLNNGSWKEIELEKRDAPMDVDDDLEEDGKNDDQ